MADAELRPVLIVLIDQFADWETPLISGIGGAFFNLKVSHATPGGGDIVSMGGLQVCGLPDLASRGDEVIVLCGSEGWTHPDAPDLEVLLRSAHQNGQPIAAICAATLALGRAGLLADRAHCSNGPDFLQYHLRDYSAQAHYRDVPHAVADGGIITAPGSAPVSFTAEVLRAAGLPEDALAQFHQLASAEHHQ